MTDEREFSDLPTDRLQGLLDLSVREVLELIAYDLDILPDRSFHERTGLAIERNGVLLPTPGSAQHFLRVPLKGPRPFAVSLIRLSFLLEASQKGGSARAVDLVSVMRPGWRQGYLARLTARIAPENEVELFTGFGYRGHGRHEIGLVRFEPTLVYGLELLVDLKRHLCRVLVSEKETGEDVAEIQVKTSMRYQEVRPDNLVVMFGSQKRTAQMRPPVGWTFSDLLIQLEP